MARVPVRVIVRRRSEVLEVGVIDGADILLRENDGIVVDPSRKALVEMLGPAYLDLPFRLEIVDAGVCLDGCRVTGENDRGLEFAFRRHPL